MAKIGAPVDFDPFEGVAPQGAMSATDAGIAPLPQPNEKTPDITSAPTGVGDSFSNFLSVMSTTDPKALQDMVVRNIDGAQAGTDKDGNPFVVLNGKPYYTNQPGMSGTDVAGFVGDLAKFFPAGKAASMFTNPLVRMGVAGVGTALTSAGSQVAAKARGSQQDFDGGQVALEGLFGTAGQGIGDLLVGFMKASRPIMDAAGNYTPDFRQAVAQLGIDISSLGTAGQKVIFDAYQSLGKQFGKDARQIVSAANTADSPIRLTAGQAAGDVRMMAKEEAMRNGARGAIAQRILGRFDNQQADDIARNADFIQGEFTPTGFPSLLNQNEAGGLLYEQLRSKAGQMKQAGKAAYEAVDPQALRVMDDAFGGLEQRVRSQFVNSDRVLDPQLTPSAYKAAQEVMNLAPKAGKANITDLSIKQLESTRKKLNSYWSAAQNPADRDAIRVIQNEFDSWLDDAVTDGLIRGDQSQLGKLKEARELWSRYKKAFKADPKAADADAQKVIEKITTKDLQPHEVMNYLYGSSEIGNSAVSQRVAARLKKTYGAESEEFKRLQEAAYLRIVKDTQGNLRSPQKVVNTIDELVMGKGSGLTRELFTAEQINAIRKMRVDLARTIVPAEAKNPSKTGYEIARLLEDGMEKLGLASTVANAATGRFGAASVTGLLGLAKQGKQAASAFKATRQASSVAPPPYPSAFTSAFAASAEPTAGGLLGAPRNPSGTR